MNQDRAQQLVSVVEAAQTCLLFANAYRACKTAGVTFADYKEARLLVYGLNTAV